MNNISKIVLDKSTGKKIGYILDVAIDFQSMQKIGYFVVDEESEGEFLIKCEDVLMVNDEYIVISDASVMQFSVDRKESLLGKEALDEHCQSLGRIKTLEFKKEKMTKVVTDRCEILPKYVKVVGKDVIFIQFKKQKVKNQRTFPKAQTPTLVSIQTVNDLSNVVVSPEKISLSANYYIGKVCGENIFGYNNEKIVLKNEIITKAIVEKAKKHNRLNQLFFAIKR